MFGFNSANKGNAVDSKHRCPEHVKANHQSVSGNEIAVNEETIMDAVWVICRFFTTMNTRLIRQDEKVSKALKARDDYSATLETCFETVADCQKQTAEFANRDIERHALYPAIRAVDQLASTICQLSQQADALSNSPHLDPQITSLIESILSAAEIAESKKASLDIQSIQPAELDESDKDMHEIVDAIDTDDKSKHKKTHKTLSAGLIYRGKILQEAKVSVYRFSDKVAEHEKSMLKSSNINERRFEDE